MFLSICEATLIYIVAYFVWVRPLLPVIKIPKTESIIYILYGIFSVKISIQLVDFFKSVSVLKQKL